MTAASLLAPLVLLGAVPLVNEAGAFLLLGDILIGVTLLFFVLAPAFTPRGLDWFLLSGGLPNRF